ncbi:lytic transglycosylase domain-containing protein [Dyella caseinilytica]|uniref:Lytic transglycosylase domain-containing protein n=2 Tax=Dyella caseinilytica TaxID=1849581 RepID=A0ABX7H179_9GAMM|nr:lytic transglycosylase domain-containing protein [Dyella caseinilytica]
MAAGLGAFIEHMVEATTHAKNLSEHLKNAADAQGQFNASTRDGESGLKKMAKEAKELGDNIFGIGKFLLKVGAIGIGSVAGGLFGLDKLGESAVSNQRSARQLGLTTGQYRAFDTDLGRDVGDSTLQHVVDSRQTFAGQFWLQKATGLSADQLKNMDSGSVAAVLAMRENQFYKSHPNANMQTIGATGFLQVGEGQADLLLHKNAPLEEQQRGFARYRSDQASLNYGGGTVDALYDFNNRLRLAGQHIETDFSDKLSELNRNGALSGFITSLEKDAEILFNGILSDKNLAGIQDGLTKLATYLGSSDFQKAVATFSDDIVNLATWVAKALGIVSPTGTGGQNGAPSDWWDPNSSNMPDPANTGANSKTWHEYNFATAKSVMGTDYTSDQYVGPGFENINPNNPSAQKNLALFKSLELQNGLPSGLVGAVAYDESRGYAHARSKSGAMGLMQLLPGTANDLGVNDPYDFGQSAAGGAKYLGQLFKKYGGEGGGLDALEKAIAAYHDGPGNIDRDIKNRGRNWMSAISIEGQGEILTVLKQIAKYKAFNTKIWVANTAGANVAVSTNAAAHS